MNDFDIKKVEIEKVDSDTFYRGFKEEQTSEFGEFLHSGNSIYYTEEEISKFDKFKPEYQDEALLHFLAKYDGEVIGRSFSNQITRDSVMMCMSFVKRDCRRKGVYNLLLEATIKTAREIGYIKVLSYHISTNNDIIIPKLRKGFCFTGLKLDAGYGTLAELTLHFNQHEKDVLDFRTGLRRPTKRVLEALKL